MAGEALNAAGSASGKASQAKAAQGAAKQKQLAPKDSGQGGAPQNGAQDNQNKPQGGQQGSSGSNSAGSGGGNTSSGSNNNNNGRQPSQGSPSCAAKDPVTGKAEKPKADGKEGRPKGAFPGGKVNENGRVEYKVPGSGMKMTESDLKAAYSIAKAYATGDVQMSDVENVKNVVQEHVEDYKKDKERKEEEKDPQKAEEKKEQQEKQHGMAALPYSPDNEEFKEKRKNPLKEAIKMKMAMGAVKGGSQLVALQFLKMLLMKLLEMLQMMASAAANFIANLWATAVGIFTQVASAIGTAAAAAAFTAVFGVVGVVIVAGVTYAADKLGNDADKRDAIIISCEERLADVMTGYTGNVDEQTRQNAQLIYSVMNQFGLADTNIAGMLGNWAKESGIDPTGIEGIYSEPFSVYGPQKVAAIDDLNVYTLNTLFPKYEKAGKSINQIAYKAPDSMYYCGVGLGQFTGPAAYNLAGVAENMGKNWWDLDVQLTYCIMPGGYRQTWLANWGEEDSAADAAERFMREWEGIDGDVAARAAAAEYWLTEIQTWAVNSSYAHSVIVAAGGVSSNATAKAAARSYKNCPTQLEYDSSSIATAAASFAYATQDAGRDNNGTALFRAVHDDIFPTSSVYMSCDITVALAVRWSGADDMYPPHNVEAQLEHLIVNTEQWKEVPWDGELIREWDEPVMEPVMDPVMVQAVNPDGTPKADASGNPVMEQETDAYGNPVYEERTDAAGNPVMQQKRDAAGNLEWDHKEEWRWYHDINSMQPGDVLICKDDELGISHTVIFVGNELITEMFPGHDEAGNQYFCTVSGSVGERSPGCGYWCRDYEDHYRVFRNIKTSAGHIYGGAGSSVYYVK